MNVRTIGLPAPRRAVPAVPGGAARVTWEQAGATLSLAVTDARALGEARRMVRAELAAVDRAASPHRGDSEVNRLLRAAGKPRKVSPLLADLLGVSLAVAARSQGQLDPTVGNATAVLRAAGRGPDRSALPVCGRWVAPIPRPAAGWRQVRLAGQYVQLPAGVSLDLSAITRAYLADRCAARIAYRLHTGVVLTVGLHVVAAGVAPPGGWWVEPVAGERFRLMDRMALGGWRIGGGPLVDPATGRQVVPGWREILVLAPTSTRARAVALAAALRGDRARAWLTELGLPARLVTAAGSPIGIGW